MSDEVGLAFTPDDFKEFATTQDETIVLGITIGLELEGQSRSFYQSLLRKLPPDTAFILKLLANEELDHLKTLLAFKTALQKNDRWMNLNPQQARRIRRPRLYEGKGGVPFIEADASAQDIVLASMRAEKRTEQFYKRVAQKARDPRAKAFFAVLANFERGHYALLKGVLETVT
jgi:rubrerythrin